MTRFYYLSIFYCFYSLLAIGQGKLVLIGGGSEDEGGWSDTPYRWAVNNSSNKKVAVISYDDQDDFIPDYFISLGATSANNIKIDSHDFANLQSTYDSLMQYDVFFFKGGDQFVYYSLYKDTKTAQAVTDKFATGGVITGTSAGMAILSKIIFTAKNDSAYPYDCLKNYKNASITLADDFLPLMDDFIFDTHFTERGRAARLISFLANWHDATGNFITGIGVDDRTALCINENKIGVVYGTGTVSVINCNAFGSVGKKLIADSINCSQLLHGHSFNLASLEIINGPAKSIVPPESEENGNYQLMLSGGTGVSANVIFLNDFIHAGELNDTVVLVTSSGKAKDYLQRLKDAGITVVLVETSVQFNGIDQIDLRNAIRDARKILFAENDDVSFFTFLTGGTTGKLIASHCRRNNMLVAFAGQDSRYAGVSFVTNHLKDEYAAYYGSLQYQKGMALLKTSVVMPDAYNPNAMDFYENTTAAVPFAMFSDSLRFGFYINRNTYLKFYHDNGKNYFSFIGDLTGIALVNNGVPMESASQPVNASGDFRNYVGFVDMKYIFMNGDMRLPAGKAKPSADIPYIHETAVGLGMRSDDTMFQVFPNPSTNGIFNLVIHQHNNDCVITLHDILGRLILSKPFRVGDPSIDLSTLPNGVYLLSLDSAEGRRVVKLINRQ